MLSLCRYNEDVTDGLTLAPPAPPSNSNSDRITTTLGNTSWWRSHWCALHGPAMHALGFARSHPMTTHREIHSAFF